MTSLQPTQKKSQREPHLYSVDHAVILGLANTLPAIAEHHRVSSIKQNWCEGEVEVMPNAMIFDITSLFTRGEIL